MPRHNCPYSRGALYSVPGPLYGRAERRSDEPVTAPAPVPAVETEDIRIIRYKHPIPASLISAPLRPAFDEALCLLRQENALLVEILASIHALTAVTLARGK